MRHTTRRFIRTWLAAACTVLALSGFSPPATPTQLAPGASAPPFEAVDAAGQPVRLADYRGRKLLLSFYRYAACVFCNLRVHDVLERYPAWAREGLSVVAFFESPPESIRDYVGKQAPPFPLVADPERQVYARFGVTARAEGAPFHRLGDMARGVFLGLFQLHPEGVQDLLPADFLIGPDGTIREAYYARDIGDHLPFERIDAFVRDE